MLYKLDTNARVEAWVHAKNDEEASDMISDMISEIHEKYGIDITVDSYTCTPQYDGKDLEEFYEDEVDE